MINKKRNGFIVIGDDEWRTIQKVVTAKSFYGSSTGRYDTVLVSRDRNEETIVAESILK